MDTLSIGLLGGGTVGSGVVRILRDNSKAIQERLGARLCVKRVLVSDASKARDAALEPHLLTEDARDIIDDPDIAIVVELIGGTTIAADYILQAIARKKHVVTANKALLARRGEEIFSAASAAGVDVFYEGAVCGGIPIIRALRESLASDRIRSVVGIVNGTTNFILTAMCERNADFDTMLKEAMRLGYAEADPTADIDNHDAAQKLSILASLGFSGMVQESDIYVEGIRDVSIDDMVSAARHGYKVKPLAIAERCGDAIAARVHPAWISEDSMLAHVDGVFNAVLLESEALGSSMFYGQGAGQLPTGSAVLADIIDMARNIQIGAAGRVPHLALHDQHLAHAKIVPIEETESAFYLRFTVTDQPGVLGRITTVLGEHDISLRIVDQEVLGDTSGGSVPVVVLTHPTKEGAVQNALRAIDQLDAVRAPTRLMRIFEAT